MIDERLYPDKPADGNEEIGKWLKRDKTARVKIGLTVSDDMLKNASMAKTALEMGQEIQTCSSATLCSTSSPPGVIFTLPLCAGAKLC